MKNLNEKELVISEDSIPSDDDEDAIQAYETTGKLTSNRPR